jgi:c-di-GMP-binding flagellar brake protein YcgR
MEKPDTPFDQRRSPRIRSEHDVSLSATPAPACLRGGEAAEPIRLFGHTRDLSACGMALVAPSFDCANLEIFGEGRELDVSLTLPVSSVAARAVAVRAAPLNQSNPGEGCVFGLEFTRMSEADSRRYAEFLSRDSDP